MTNKEYAVIVLEKVKLQCRHFSNVECDYNRLARGLTEDELLAKTSGLVHVVTLEDIDIMIKEVQDDNIIVKPASPHNPDMTGNCTNGQLKEQMENNCKGVQDYELHPCDKKKFEELENCIDLHDIARFMVNEFDVEYHMEYGNPARQEYLSKIVNKYYQIIKVKEDYDKLEFF